MIERELVIENVTVIDGTGRPGFAGSVGIDGDRITELRGGEVSPTGGGGGPDGGAGDVGAEGGRRTVTRIDGTGLVLAPGFVDVHTHDDTAVLFDPDLSCKTLQGVTSVVVGNCGVSTSPASDHSPGFTVHARVDDYLRAVAEAGPAVNVAALVGHGTVRAAVMGLKTARPAEPAELSAMAEHVARAMADGAIGLSSGLAYEPGRYAAPDELVGLNRLVAAAGGIYTTHLRDEGQGLIRSIDESIAVAEATGVPLQISHLKASGRDSWGMVGPALERIDRARADGLDVMADQYPYTRGSTLLEQVVVAGALDGPSAFGHVTPAEVLVAAAPGHPRWEGRTVAEIADAEGVDGRRMADRIVEAEGRACIVVIDTMDEGDVRTVMGHGAVMIGTDGLPMGQKPHPRLHHTYPRVLGRYVRDERVLGLADAVRRMTSTPARRFGFTDRGEIRTGALADLVLFDPERIVDTGTWADPTAVPAGIVGVWVNGRRVVEGGAVTGARPGRVVRRGDG
jgi:N-acyl-D-amino-acid deacylase